MKKKVKAARKVRSKKVHRVTHTEELERMVVACLDGENVDPIVRKLSKPDQELFYEIVTELRGSNDARTQELYKIDYDRTPPSMEEFLEDDYWIGAKTRPSADNPTGIYPTWKEILTRDFDYDSKIHNVVLTGSLGGGKSYTMVVLLLYKLTLARLLRQPAITLGLNRGSRIFFTLLSVSKQVVEQTVFGDLKDFMTVSRFFSDECRFNPDVKYTDFCIPLGRGIFASAGSKGWHTVGRNVIGVGLDEGNFRNEADPDVTAYKLYQDARVRIQNRFQKMAGFNPGISIIASSAKTESSFTEKAIKEINEVNNPVMERVYRFPSYVTKKGTQGYIAPEKYFRVSHGLKNVDPMLLRGWCKEDGSPINDQEVLEQPPQGAQIEIVPEMFHDAFIRNTRSSLQDISGVATGGNFRLFQSMTDFNTCIKLSSYLVNPCNVTQIPLSMDDENGVWDYLNHKAFLTKVMSKVQPKKDPHALRFGHIDLATMGQAGVSICHGVGQTLVEGLYTPDAVQPFSEYRLVVEFDFILTIVGGASKPISIEKIQRFFFWLKEQCGYHFGLVTADQFNSAMPLQMMQSRGFETDLLSVDRNKGPYYALRDAVAEHRVRLFHQSTLFQELENLVDGPKKVDHLPDQTKDVADSVAGALFNCLNSQKIDPTLAANSIPVLPDDKTSEQETPPVAINMPTFTYERRPVFL